MFCLDWEYLEYNLFGRAPIEDCVLLPGEMFLFPCLIMIVKGVDFVSSNTDPCSMLLKSANVALVMSAADVTRNPMSSTP